MSQYYLDQTEMPQVEARSTAPQNISLRKVAQGWVLTWEPPIKLPTELLLASDSPSEPAPLAQMGSVTSVQQKPPNLGQQRSNAAFELLYMIEYKPTPSTSWQPLASTSDKSMLVKDLKPGNEYAFRIFAQKPGFPLRSMPSSEYKFTVPDNRRKPGSTQALSAGVVSGILFFIACIVIAVCAVNICNKRRKKRAEKGKLGTNQSQKQISNQHQN